jgi:hypothetical protein
MAIETEEFSRDDIYTLFVTTRIINFLKGLPLRTSTELTDLLRCEWNDTRTQAGFELLKRLAETQKLYFWSKQGLVENRHFNSAVYLRVLAETQFIRCQNGASIHVKTTPDRAVSWPQKDPLSAAAHGDF